MNKKVELTNLIEEVCVSKDYQLLYKQVILSICKKMMETKDNDLFKRVFNTLNLIISDKKPIEYKIVVLRLIDKMI